MDVPKETKMDIINNGGLLTPILYSLTSLLILNFCLQILLAMPSLVSGASIPSKMSFLQTPILLYLLFHVILVIEH